jgi:hypothetical protein
MSTTNYIKPIAMAGCVIAGDKFILKETDMNRSMYLGAAGAAGVLAAQMVAPMITTNISMINGAYTDSKTLELRVLEISGAVGVAFVLNKFVLKNEIYVNNDLNKIALLAGADFVAEYIDDYLSGRTLSFFK